MKDVAALEARLVQIARSLPEELLSGEDADALIADLGAGGDRLLGFYTEAGMHAALESYGLFDTLRARGYRDLRVEFDLEDYAHGLRLYGDDLLLCDCRLRRARGATDPCIAETQRRFEPDLLVVDWLALADPRRGFTPERPRLPGQVHPGSGIGVEVFLLLCICARRLNLHGLLETPERFHNAVLYRRRAHFIDPGWEGTFLALTRLLRDHALAEVAWAMEEGRVVDAATGAPIIWRPREQLLPLDPRLEAYYELPAWRRERSVAEARCRPRLIRP